MESNLLNRSELGLVQPLQSCIGTKIHINLRIYNISIIHHWLYLFLYRYLANYIYSKFHLNPYSLYGDELEQTSHLYYAAVYMEQACPAPTPIIIKQVKNYYFISIMLVDSLQSIISRYSYLPILIFIQPPSLIYSCFNIPAQPDDKISFERPHRVQQSAPSFEPQANNPVK